MRTLLIAILAGLTAAAASSGETVTLLHFSDYHSHAVPFFTERGPAQGGIARAVGYLEREKKAGALVFSGGDMMNKGAPAWSDKYRCAEWPWLNGIVDAMALGNHDADYGMDAFESCRRAIRYPILSANTVGFEPFRVFEVKGRKIGVFAVAGRDVPQLMTATGLKFSDPVVAARRAVEHLRGERKVDAVVMIGHQQTEDDYAIARTVPGVDVIFGTHAHLARDLTKIAGTNTWFISPGQYLEWISRVELTFTGDGLGVRGRLVPVDRSMRESTGVARQVAQMQRDLERDPEFAARFETVAVLDRPLPVADLASRTLSVMKSAAGARVALSTVSSFRGSLDRGPLTLEALTAVLPYDNEIVVCDMTGADVKKLTAESERRNGTDSESYVDALETIDDDTTYRVAMTDYMARVAWADVIGCTPAGTGIRVRSALLESFRADSKGARTRLKKE